MRLSIRVLLSAILLCGTAGFVFGGASSSVVTAHDMAGVTLTIERWACVTCMEVAPCTIALPVDTGDKCEKVALIVAVPSVIRGLAVHLTTITINGKPLMPAQVDLLPLLPAGPTDYTLNFPLVVLLFNRAQFVQCLDNASLGSHAVNFSAKFAGGHLLIANDAVTVTGPCAPTLCAPANGATGVPRIPALSWSTVPGVTSYTLEIAPNAAFTGATVLTGLTTTSQTVSNLTCGTTYYWHVKAVAGTASSA
ncbi:MAG TPA: hypothetical protein VGM23_17900, partial [Armatimonadota bacterium]